jgi:predicted phosphate transport protein (TIGR00153 family)
MEKVSVCIHKVVDLFDALQKHDLQTVEKIAQEISELEHQADLTKNDIRNHLHKNIYLPIDRSNFLDILSIQDSIADAAEDIAVLITFKDLKLLESFKGEFNDLLMTNIKSFNSARNIIKELHDLIESSFGGHEAEKVRLMVEDVAYQEHEADLIQRKLLKNLFASESQMTYSTFFLWLKICEAIASISNLSEKLANRIRMTLDLK